MITKKPWFGPKRFFGWGWTPVTWEGWLSVLVWVGLVYLVVHYYGASLYLLLPLIAILIAFGYLTGTKPGGRWL